MSKLLTLILGWFTQHLIISVFKYIFSGFIGLASYQFVSILINRYILSAVSELNVISEIAAMMNLARFDDAISIILSAFAIRGSIISMGLVVIKGGTE